MENIVQFQPDNDAIDLRAAFDQIEHGNEHWIEGFVKASVLLAKGRVKHGSDRAFSRWLSDNRLHYFGDDDRAALINMACDIKLLRDILMEQRGIFRPNTIWQKSKDRFRMDSKPQSSSTSVESSAAIPTKKPIISQTAEATIVPITMPGDIERIVLRQKNSRTSFKQISEPGRKEMRKVMRTLVQEGILVPHDNSVQSDKPNLRLMFPTETRRCGFRESFDLRNKSDRDRIIQEVLPAALANKERLIADPTCLSAIVDEYRRQSLKTAKITIAAQTMPATQQRVAMYGVQLWPRVEVRFGEYEYEQLLAAVWYFRDNERWLAQSTIAETSEARAHYMRLSLWWPLQYFERQQSPAEREVWDRAKKICTLVSTIANLMRAKPDGECVVPPSPHVEGQW